MSVEYKENAEGMYWVDGDQQGTPQKDLHHAMKDYENTLARKATPTRDSEQRVHTGDDGGPGEIADDRGSAGEGQEANTDAAQEGARGSVSGFSSSDAADSGSGGGEATS